LCYLAGATKTNYCNSVFTTTPIATNPT